MNESDTLVLKVKELISNETIVKKDLMRIEKLAEKGRLKNTGYGMDGDDVLRNIESNRQRAEYMEAFKNERRKCVNMRWGGHEYIISAITLGYTHNYQHQINYKSRSQYMFLDVEKSNTVANTNHVVIIKQQLFRYLAIAMYVFKDICSNDHILLSMCLITGRTTSYVVQ
jgi:hypothetical protein